MTKITVAADCGHAPKKAFLRDFNIAFAKGNADFIIKHVSKDIEWIIYGDTTYQGKQSFSEAVHQMKEYVADELVLHSIITHGREAAVNGEMIMGNTVYSFCDVYRFTNSTEHCIKSMRSYLVKQEALSKS